MRKTKLFKIKNSKAHFFFWNVFFVILKIYFLNFLLYLKLAVFSYFFLLVLSNIYYNWEIRWESVKLTKKSRKKWFILKKCFQNIIWIFDFLIFVIFYSRFLKKIKSINLIKYSLKNHFFKKNYYNSKQKWFYIQK